VKRLKYLLALAIFYGTQVFANWSVNLGYNNPPGAAIGANFCYFWTNWAFEAGLGSVNSTSTNSGNSTTTVSVGGDVNFKYLFGSGLFRPYLQGGAGVGIGAGNGVGAGIGGGFAGAGFFLKGSDLYAYFSYNLGGGGFLQGGLGIFL